MKALACLLVLLLSVKEFQCQVTSHHLNKWCSTLCYGNPLLSFAFEADKSCTIPKCVASVVHLVFVVRFFSALIGQCP